MAVEGMVALKDSRVAGADLSAAQYKFVEMGSDGTVTVCNAVTDVPYGVLQNNPVSGAMAEIVIIGLTKVSSDAGLTAGALIGTSADGQAAAYVAGTDTTKYIVGLVRNGTSNAAEMATAVVNCAAPSRGA